MGKDYQKRIIKELEHILPTGSDQARIFEDWLDMVHASLEALPAHTQSAVKDKKFAEDTEETKKLWERLNSRYKPEYFVFFQKAFAVLIEAADETFEDIIGDCYMEWGCPNKHTGQFFTPYNLAKMMAEVTVDPEEATRRLCTAWEQCKEGKMHKFIAEQEGNPGRVYDFVKTSPESVIPFCAELIDPITINDPACGSGVMLLAAAEMFPAWARDWGVVRFYGQDIDQTCVRMAGINMMLHNLNGFGLKLELAANAALEEIK